MRVSGNARAILRRAVEAEREQTGDDHGQDVRAAVQSAQRLRGPVRTHRPAAGTTDQGDEQE